MFEHVCSYRELKLPVNSFQGTVKKCSYRESALIGSALIRSFIMYRNQYILAGPFENLLF